MPSGNQSPVQSAHETTFKPSLSSSEDKSPSHATSLSDNNEVTALHVRPGAEHKALIYLLRQINRRFQMDDVMPDLPGRGHTLSDHSFTYIHLRQCTWVKSSSHHIIAIMTTNIKLDPRESG